MLPATLLTLVEERITGGVPAGRYFDMIAGTSTGGILALGLGTDHSAAAIRDLYVEHGPKIFPRRYAECAALRWLQKATAFVSDVRRYRYKADALEAALDNVFAGDLFGISERRLVIAALDWNTEVNVFKTPHHEDYKRDWKETLKTVARATSAAPTFFKAYEDGERRFLDGGLWANNPTMCAVVDALACYDVSRRAISVLSLGCAESGYTLKPGHAAGGLWTWREVFSASVHLQSQNAVGQARLLLGGDKVLRVDAQLTDPIDMDDYARSAAELPGAAEALFAEHEDALREFFDVQRPPYPAFYGPRALT